MEESLAKWFKFSEAWEAIMLIDEADVYFERRGGGQLKRNSLVSAFLRSMEYYRGILFLTVWHLALKYYKLTQSSIYTNNHP